MTKTSRYLRPIRVTLVATALALSLGACGDSPESLLAKAKESIDKKETKAAEIHLKNLLQKEDVAEARYLLGKLYLESGDVHSAEKELQRALDSGYDRGQVAPALADALLRLGSYQRVLNEVANASPEQPEAKAMLLTAAGRAQLALGKRDAARTSFESALTANTSYTPARVALIALQASGGDVPGASAQLDRVLAERPDSAEALALKGDLELSLGRPKEALALFAKAAAADPQNRAVRAKMAAINIDLKDYEAAQKSIDELKNLTGPAPATMHLQALLYTRTGKLEPARDAIQQALKVAPDYLPSLALGAQIYLALNLLDQAETYATRVRDAAPNSTIGYRLLGALHLRRGSPDKVLALIEPVLQRDTSDPTLWGIAGEAALRANEAQKAEKYFAQASKLDPKSTMSKTGRALAMLAQGNKERGVAELEQASEMGGSGTQADFALIMTYLRDRNYEKALAAVDELEKKQPTSAIAPNLRGSVLGAKGDTAGARKAFETALERDPKFFPATANLASLDLREKKIDNAKQRYAALLSKDPKNVRAMLALAQIEQGTHNVELAQQRNADLKAGKTLAPPTARGDKEALEWLKKAHMVDKGSIPVVLALAGWYIGNQQPKDAIPPLQEALATAPDNIQLLDMLGTAYMGAQQPVQAMEAFEKILRIKPDSVTLHMRMGQLKLSRGDTIGAMQSLRKASELAPKAVEPRAALAAAHLRAGRPDEARKIAAALQKDQPKSGAGFQLEGDIAMAVRKFADAAGAYRKALGVEKAPSVQIKLHNALRLSGSDKEADALLVALVKERPDNIQVRMYAGEVKIAQKQWTDAITHYDVVIAVQPNNALALNNAAWALHELKDPRALEYAEKAVAAAPGAPAVLDTLGVILSYAGNHERALKLMRQAVSIAPKATNYRVNLAEALIRAGDNAAAKVQLEIVNKEVGSGPLADKAKSLLGKL